MAAKNVVEKGVKDLEEEITCAICHEHYKDPKVLPCCHYYCKQCLLQLALAKGANNHFPCPECRKDTAFPEGGVDHLPTAFFVNRMKEVHSKLELFQGKVEARCESCSEDVAKGFCRQCTKFLCVDCSKSHLKMKKLFPGHVVSTLEELREGGAENVTVEEPSLKSCDVHEQPMSIYCYDCKLLICRDCTIIKLHRDHNYEFVKVAASTVKKELIQQLGPLQESTTSMVEGINIAKSTLSELQDKEQSVNKKIIDLFDEIQSIINSHKQRLLGDSAAKVEQKSKHLLEQVEGLSIACADVQSVIDYTERCVKHLGDDEIMCMHEEIQSRIEKQKSEQQQQMDLHPVEDADLGVDVNCIEDLKLLFQRKAKVVQVLVDPTKCIISEGVGSAEVSKESCLHLSVKLSDGSASKLSCKVESSLQSIASNSTIKCEVHQVSRGDYRIQYTPTLRGRHELTVTVNEQHVAGSPFLMFVSIPPALLCKPVTTIAGLKEPYEVAVDKAGNVMVTQHLNFSIFNKKGENIKSLPLSQHIVGSPYGVAVDNEANTIYISKRNVILKLSSDLNVQVRYAGRDSLNYGRMVIVGDEVMVCDYNSRCVMVFSKDLVYVRFIGSYGKGLGEIKEIRGVSSDGSGNVYITDRGKCCIHVFSNGGVLLHTIMHTNIRHPVGAAVSNQHIFVADYDEHCVLVFSTVDGSFVTSFGQSSIKCPRGVCTDQDGFIYVCSNDNQNVMVF